MINVQAAVPVGEDSKEGSNTSLRSLRAFPQRSLRLILF